MRKLVLKYREFINFMTADRWKRVADIYDSVVVLPPAARGTMLDEACGSDADLRREVESLLEARGEAGSFLSLSDLRDHICDLSDSEAAPGSTFGRYQVLSVIGAGGMGEVYLAQDAELNRQVALKVLPAQFTNDEERIARFRREARAASVLNHPNVVTIYDVGQTGDTWFIATEFVEGTTLRARLAEGPKNIPGALDIALQCARGLEAAHKAGIVHRDVKPENIIVRQDGVVKIVDFGLARGAEDGLGELLGNATRTGAVMGTPRYMSPEQARGQKLDPRTDIFSLGAVLYEMITGRPAFPGATTADVFAALLSSAPEPVAATGLNSILQKALAKDRDARYQTVDAFAQDLEYLREHPAGFVPATKDTRHSRVSRRAMLAGAGALVAGAGLAGLRLRLHRPLVQEPLPMSVVPVTSFSGYKDFGSVSPDGQRIVFSWNGAPNGSGGRLERNIYTKSVGNGEPVRLTFAQQDETYPAWSPDGRQIAFCRLLDSRHPYLRFAILIVPAAGGAERNIAEGGNGVAWSPDGKDLVFTGLPPQNGGIFRVSLETGARTRLTRSAANLDELPVLSPDGQWIVFTRSFSPIARELFIVPGRGGRERQLTFDHQPTYGAAWTADAKEIVFSSNRASGGESLWRMPLDGGFPRRLPMTLGSAFYPAISRKGDALVYTESFKDTNIYLSEGAGFAGGSVPGHFGPQRGLILSSRRDDSPSISPAGDRIAFVSRRTGNEEIWVCDRDGGHLMQLTAFDGPATGTPRWSPDGRWLAFDSMAMGNPNIYVTSAQGGTPRQLTSGASGNYMPSWSSDGKRIYFKSDRSGSDQLWSIPALGGSATQITRGGASEGFPSPDGKLIYYIRVGWGAIWSVPTDGGVEKPVPELQRFDRIFRSWGVVGQGIYFISREEGPRQTVRFFSFETRQVSPILTLDKEPIWDYPAVALSPDGRRLLTARLDLEVNDLMMVENFH